MQPPLAKALSLPTLGRGGGLKRPFLREVTEKTAESGAGNRT